jgi:FMN phosphatase YigB (HAD superfamily)
MVMPELVFLFDMDNTLLDNDRVKADLEARIAQLVGPEHGSHFWRLYEEVRQEYDYVDFPRTLERFRVADPEEPRFPYLAALLLCYPYESSVFPGALDAIAHLKSLGTVAIVSDGDPVFQSAKLPARAWLRRSTTTCCSTRTKRCTWMRSRSDFRGNVASSSTTSRAF